MEVISRRVAPPAPAGGGLRHCLGGLLLQWASRSKVLEAGGVGKAARLPSSRAEGRKAVWCPGRGVLQRKCGGAEAWRMSPPCTLSCPETLSKRAGSGEDRRALAKNPVGTGRQDPPGIKLEGGSLPKHTEPQQHKVKQGFQSVPSGLPSLKRHIFLGFVTLTTCGSLWTGTSF